MCGPKGGDSLEALWSCLLLTLVSLLIIISSEAKANDKIAA